MRMQQLSNRSSGYEREREFLCVVDGIAAVAAVAGATATAVETQIFPIYVYIRNNRLSI